MKHNINVDIFQALLNRALEIYNQNFGKFPISATIHKFLFHGAEVIKNSPVPMCYLSEEAAETKLKFIRYFREHFSRKDSLEHTLVNIFNQSMDMSDPKIASLIRQQQRKKRAKEIPQEVKNLLIIQKMKKIRLYLRRNTL